MMTKHTPVMLNEVIELLDVQPGGEYIDATLGGGGYTEKIIERSAPDGRVLALDLNEQALEEARGRFGPRSIIYRRRKPSYRSRSESAPEGGTPKSDTVNSGHEERILLAHGNFRHIEDIALSYQFQNVAGITFDLGLSSDLLERSGRGFSFQKTEPLEMTYSHEASTTARDVVNEYSVAELTGIFKEYGEIRQAERITEQIRRSRKKQRIATTTDLRDVIEEAVKSATPKLLAQVWQALRIEVNGELESLEQGLAGAWNILGTNGVIAVVSFHSLEDRIVKHFIRSKEKAGEGAALTDGPMGPSKKEMVVNPRARSAKLRGIRKLEVSENPKH